jgi:Flp pilus assembly protein TadG
MTMRRLPSFWRDQRGAAAAEMALITPLVLVLLFAMMEGGHFMWSEHKVVKGVRDAARYAARLDFSQYNCGSNAFTGDLAAVQNLARTGQLTGGTAKVPGWVNANVSLSVTCASSQTGLYDVVGGNAPRVRVSAAVPYPSLFGALGFTSSSLTLRAAAESPVMGL